MTTTQNIAPLVPNCITARDQNRQTDVRYDVADVIVAGPNVQAQTGWTHSLLCHRPKGRKSFMVWAEFDPTTGCLVRHSSPVALAF